MKSVVVVVAVIIVAVVICMSIRGRRGICSSSSNIRGISSNSISSTLYIQYYLISTTGDEKEAFKPPFSKFRKFPKFHRGIFFAKPFFERFTLGI